MNRWKSRIMIAALAALLPAAGWSAAGAAEGRRQGPPPEALTACEGKSAGDAVQFTNRRGETVNATCREKDGRLVALPDAPRGGRHWGKGCGDGWKDDGRHLSRLAERLNLNQGQQEEVRKILAAEREKAAPLREKMKESRARLREAIHSGTADEASIRSLAKAQAEVKAELVVARAQAWQQIHALLTPEQRELAKEAGPFGPGPEGKRKGRHPRG